MQFDAKLGDEIKFYLNGHWMGRGIVRAIYSHTVEVELTTVCNQHAIGAMLLIKHKEIV